jgi:hypothetical protein
MMGEVRHPNKKELNATLVFEFCTDEAAAKIRSDPGVDEELDMFQEVRAGILPFTTTT